MDNFDLSTDDLGAENTSSQAIENTSDVGSQQPIENTTGPQRYKYTAAGKEVEEDLDTVLKRASMGYHYAQNMAELKAQRQELEKKEAWVKESEGKWSHYDSYASQNPQWADFVRQQWENRSALNGNQTQMPQSDTTGLSPELQREFAELRSFKDEFKGFMNAQRQEREDAALNNQIDETRKLYSDIDFSYSDPSTGQTLEQQILQHCQTHGINNFKSGFRDFYHDKLMARAVTRAKEETAKTLQQRQQQGYIAEGNTPFQGLKNPNSVRGKSYYDLIDEGIEELGLT